MINRLMPDEIARLWPHIKVALEESLPPVVGEVPDKMNRVLASLLSGRAQVWLSYEKGEEFNRVEGVVVTRVEIDAISGTRSLLIYSVFAADKVSESSWANGYVALSKYAKSRGCVSITAYTDVPWLLEIVKKYGGTINQRFITFPLI